MQTDLYNSRIKYAKSTTTQEKKKALRELRQAVNEFVNNLFDALSTLVEAITPLMDSFNNRKSKTEWLQNRYETG
jgi:F0F1-type ATP synthase membrane subunit b/b'